MYGARFLGALFVRRMRARRAAAFIVCAGALRAVHDVATSQRDMPWTRQRLCNSALKMVTNNYINLCAQHFKVISFQLFFSSFYALHVRFSIFLWIFNCTVFMLLRKRQGSNMSRGTCLRCKSYFSGRCIMFSICCCGRTC